MKNLLIIAIVSLTFAVTLRAQGNLQFNQVKLIGSVETVPDGKVWKINGIMPSGRMTVVNQNGSSSLNHVITVNGTTVYYATADATGSLFGNGQTGFTAVSANISASTLWLPATTTLAAGTGVYRISVTEFDVIP